MAWLHYVRPNNLNQLHDELLATLPSVRGALTVEGRGDDIWLTLPGETDEATIATIGAIVANHAPKPPALPPALTDAEKNLLRTIAGSSEDLTPAQLSQGLRTLFKLIRSRSGDIN